MLIIKRGYQRRYVYGGSGILDTVGSVVSKIIANNAVQKIAANTAKKALEFTGKKAVDVIGKQVKKLIGKKQNQNTTASHGLSPQASATLQNIVDSSIPVEKSLNNIIAGSGQAESIQSLARRLNKGSGLKII